MWCGASVERKACSAAGARYHVLSCPLGCTAVQLRHSAHLARAFLVAVAINDGLRKEAHAARSALHMATSPAHAMHAPVCCFTAACGGLQCMLS